MMAMFSRKRKEFEMRKNLSICFSGQPGVGKSTFIHCAQKLYDRTHKIPKAYNSTSAKEEKILFYDDFMFNLIDLPGHNSIENIKRVKEHFAQKCDAFVLIVCNIKNMKEEIMEELYRIKSFCGDDCDKPIFLIFNKIDLLTKEEQQMVIKSIESMNLNRRYNGKIVYGLTSFWQNKYYGEDHTSRTRGYVERRNPLVYVYEFIINEINKDWVYSNSPIYLKK